MSRSGIRCSDLRLAQRSQRSPQQVSHNLDSTSMGPCTLFDPAWMSILLTCGMFCPCLPCCVPTPWCGVAVRPPASESGFFFAGETLLRIPWSPSNSDMGFGVTGLNIDIEMWLWFRSLVIRLGTTKFNESPALLHHTKHTTSQAPYKTPQGGSALGWLVR